MMKNIGLEPITFCLLGKCSTAWANLSIKSNCCKCLKAGSRTWTRNPFITSEMHYHCAIPAGCFPCWRGNNWCFVIRICLFLVGRRVCPYLLPKMRNVGLEPTRRMTPDSKSGAAANYANSANSRAIFMYWWSPLHPLYYDKFNDIEWVSNSVILIFFYTLIKTLVVDLSLTISTS